MSGREDSGGMAPEEEGEELNSSLVDFGINQSGRGRPFLHLLIDWGRNEKKKEKSPAWHQWD